MNFTWDAHEEGEVLGGTYFPTYLVHVCLLDGQRVGDIEDAGGKWYADVIGGEGGKFRSLEDAKAFVEDEVARMKGMHSSEHGHGR